MSPKATSRVAWGVWALTLVTTAGALALVALDRSMSGGGIQVSYVVIAVIAGGYATAGALITSRVRGNPVGWILLGMGLALALGALSEQYVLRGLVEAPGSLPATGFMAWLGNWIYQLVVVPVSVVFLLFPTGRLASRRWRWVLRASIGAAIVGVLGSILYPGEEDGITNSLKDHGLRLINPTGIQSTKVLMGGALAVAAMVGLAAAFLAIVSIVLRYRRADGEEREQIKWLAFVAIGTLALFVILATSSLYLSGNSPAGDLLWIVTFAFGLLGIPAAVTMAILKYRLYDIDFVINKTVVFGALAAFITAVYVAIVVGIGAAIGQGSQPNLGLSILATAVVAVAFQPVRERVQRFANRLVYGKRATPYEVLSEFSSRMAGTYESEDLLPRMARILAEGTGAESSRVWLKVGDVLKAEASWPATDDQPPVPMKDGALPAVPDASLVLPVRHRGDLLGALSLTKPPGERLTPAEEKLAGDLASGAGLVLRNVRLTEELLARLEELRASRQRLVAAQDQERRRLERNIHDGAQQQLVALAVKIRLARQLGAKDPDKASDLLEQTEAEVSQALEDLRDLARGIYPPLLADQGLVAALKAQARKSPVRVAIDAEGIGRYPQETEAAVYFCTLEALQNVAKYAGASRAVVRLAEGDGDFAFEVEDDGAGFDTSTLTYGTGLQGMADRLSAMGGELAVTSAPGRGATVAGRLPVRTLEPAG